MKGFWPLLENIDALWNRLNRSWERLLLLCLICVGLKGQESLRARCGSTDHSRD